MADPNFAACMEMIAFAADVLDELESYTSTSSTGLLATTEALRNDVEGDYGLAAIGPIAGFRQQVAQALSVNQVRAVMDPLLRQTAVAINHPSPDGPIEDIWEALYDYMVDNSQTLNDPEDTLDTSATAGGSNVGDGSVFVLLHDENGNLLGHLTDDFTMECVADARTLGRTQVEEWIFEGTDPRPDNLDYAGTGIQESLRTLSGDLSKAYVKNPSFNNYDLDISSNLTGLLGWTQQTGGTLATNLSINTTYTYRSVPGDNQSASLQFNGDETIVQDLVTVAGAQINPDVPFMISIAVAKVGTPTGTVTFRLSGTVGSGGVSVSLAHGAMTGSGTFDRIQITGTNNVNCWPRNWNANDLKAQIALSSSGSIDASNYFVVDDIVFTPLSRIGDFGDPRTGRGSMGRWAGVTGGPVPFVLGDTFSFSDTLGGTRGVTDWALTKLGRYGRLPVTTGGTETIADK